MTVRWASVNSTMHAQPTTAPVLPWNATVKPTVVNDSLTAYFATLRPFSAPPSPTLQQPIPSPLVEEGMQLTSTLRKRRLKMNKHKHKKLRKRTRALRKRLGK
ncbi:hypothetical protein BCR42DRAFT_432420 [Absidia repens]|uniref:Small ribosomal subunit protein mS38 n=1 Tax=Absidia repens TaxID=90262 RepID=A0A1X2IYY9_9FUNG|nr:hypothetical protein BCR42DRAFT_432420 [Absidia repens]